MSVFRFGSRPDARCGCASRSEKQTLDAVTAPSVACGYSPGPRHSAWGRSGTFLLTSTSRGSSGKSPPPPPHEPEVGCHDTNIYLFRVDPCGDGDGARISVGRTMRGMSATVSHVMFCNSSVLLASTVDVRGSVTGGDVHRVGNCRVSACASLHGSPALVKPARCCMRSWFARREFGHRRPSVCVCVCAKPLFRIRGRVCDRLGTSNSCFAWDGGAGHSDGR